MNSNRNQQDHTSRQGARRLLRTNVLVGSPALALALVMGACSGGSDDEESIFTAEEQALIETMSPLPPVPPDPTNRYADDAAAAELGQKFFFENRYAGPLSEDNECTDCGAVGMPGDEQVMSCAQCHAPTSFSDTRSSPNNVSLGVLWGTRNTPSLVNAAYYEWYGWGGKQDSMWTQASLSPESGSNSKGDRLAYAHVIWEHYKDEYNAVFSDTPLPEALDPDAEDADRFPAHGKPKKSEEDEDGAWEGMTEEDQHAINVITANQGKAVAAYERLLVSGNAPFDKFVAGDSSAMSLSAQRGLKLFIGKAACVACHSGPTFSDQKFHNTGVPQLGDYVPEEDAGRYKDISSVLSHQFNTSSEYSDDPDTGKLDNLEAKESDLGAFRTKQLRNVADSAPYLHTGYYETLRDVVEFYNEGGATSGFVGKKDELMVPLNLTDSEIDDIVAFLNSLTGEPIPEKLTKNTAND